MYENSERGMEQQKKTLMRDMFRANTEIQTKKGEIATMKENMDKIKASVIETMIKSKEPFMDCGKHGCIELRRTGKVAKDARMTILSKFFKGDATRAAQLIEFEKEEKKKLVEAAWKKEPVLYVSVCVDEEGMGKLRNKYCPQSAGIFDGL